MIILDFLVGIKLDMKIEKGTHLSIKQAVEMTTMERDQHAINCKENRKHYENIFRLWFIVHQD